jgi:hypothetical protein
MSNNPFAKFVVDPTKALNPNTIKPNELEQYTSTEMRRMQQNMKVFKRSAVYLAGCVGFMFAYGMILNGATRTSVLGPDSTSFS